MDDRKLRKAIRRQGLLSRPAHGAPEAVHDEHGRGVSWAVFLIVVFWVLCVGAALGFGVSERLQERELLWRWLLHRSERTIDDVAYRYGELWLKQLRLDPNTSPVLEGRLKAQRERLEQLGTAMLADEPAPATNLELDLRSTMGGTETEIVFVNGTEAEIAYYWVDEDGFDHYYGHVAAGSGACQHTFEGHVWVVKDGVGGTLSVYRATLLGNLAVVTSALTADR